MKRTVALIIGLVSAPAAQAASMPPTTLMAGTVAGGAVNGPTAGCSINPGQAFFQRSAVTAVKANPPAMISLPPVFQQVFRVSSDEYEGILLLKFSSATAGTVYVDHSGNATGKLPSGETVPFTNYEAVWTPSAFTLRVTFSLVFKDCALPITALFRAAP
jgi:hypothetical protein